MMKPIEYIGAAPVKLKRRSSFGGWLLVIFALLIGGFFLRPLVPFLRAQQDLTSDANVSEAVSTLRSDGGFDNLLAAAALERTLEKVLYDGAYFKIDFPGGDIPADRGKAEDLIIRTYRKVDIDLQVEVHEDISQNYHAYPQVFDSKEADPNIDHRRAQNLQRFFARKGETLTISEDAIDYSVGDIVVWQLLNGDKHLGIIVPGPGIKKTEKWVVHNLGSGPEWSDALFDFRVIGHYRYSK
jgi:uncharacterized protein YijF (DUF1287 family)